MIKKLIFPIIILLLLVIINYVIQPYLYDLELKMVITKSQYCIIYWSLNAAVTVVIAVILFILGIHMAGIKQFSLLIILNAVLDLIRIIYFPELVFVCGIYSMFTGIMMCAYGIVVYKRLIFKRGAGIFFLLSGPIYIIRFPFFADVLLAYTTGWVAYAEQAKFYLSWTIYFNYLVIIFGIFAIVSVIREKQSIYSIKKTLYKDSVIMDVSPRQIKLG